MAGSEIYTFGGVHSHVAWVSQLGVTGWAIISGKLHNSISRYCGDHSVRDLADARIVPVRDEEVSKRIDGDAGEAIELSARGRTVVTAETSSAVPRYCGDHSVKHLADSVVI
jgi:hypothetical protein